MLNVFFGTEKDPDAGFFLIYYNDDFCQGYLQTEEDFRALTRDDNLPAFMSDDDFRSSNTRFVELGYNLIVFDIRYQQNFTASRAIKGEIKFDGNVFNDMNGYALVVTSKLVSMSRDGQRIFDLVRGLYSNPRISL